VTQPNLANIAAWVDALRSGRYVQVGDSRAVQAIAARTLDEVAGEQYPDRHYLGLRPAAAFNDHPDTTWADVEVVLDKASVLWDERYGGAS
jgi:hypothetical protein